MTWQSKWGSWITMLVGYPNSQAHSSNSYRCFAWTSVFGVEWSAHLDKSFTTAPLNVNLFTTGHTDLCPSVPKPRTPSLPTHTYEPTPAGVDLWIGGPKAVVDIKNG
ncbi:hypothetical protein AVEN_184131-1 [Araneus ventricosus]|uniref:Uncharacterized protein n=1 Tax=Araneus ventricosus TaxID=182803 RepID=A0A4Y2S4H3_ARAVE|nr:hypothetical protein AVEN_245347-1 [Araneus ventricosus]GBN82165.1 hypothetical protein AVEN_184131-1 [Araneus ventricosus]